MFYHSFVKPVEGLIFYWLHPTMVKKLKNVSLAQKNNDRLAVIQAITITE